MGKYWQRSDWDMIGQCSQFGAGWSTYGVHYTGFILLYVIESFHNKQYRIGIALCTSYSSAFCPSSFTQPLKVRGRIQICHWVLSFIDFLWHCTIPYFRYMVIDPTCSMTLDTLSCIFPFCACKAKFGSRACPIG